MTDVNFIALDLDGTLLHDDHSVSDYTVEIWKKLQNKGIHVVPASGRPFPAMKEAVPVDVCEYLVCTNGVHVFKNKTLTQTQGVKTGQTQWENTWDKSLPWNIAKQIFEVPNAVQPKIHVHCYVGDTLYARNLTPELIEYQQRAGLSAKMVESWDELEGKRISKVMCLSSHEVLLELQKHFVPFKDTFMATFSMPMYLEIFSIQASKANALEHIMKVYNTSPNHALAMGDSYNDLPMLEFCKYAYVMKNGFADIAPHLPRTEYTNNEDGAAKLLEKLFL